LVRDVPVQYLSDSVKVNPMFKYLELKGFDFADAMVSYFSEKEQMFVFLGRYPFSKELSIPLEEIER
jgi:hypothetical protein